MCTSSTSPLLPPLLLLLHDCHALTGPDSDVPAWHQPKGGHDSQLGPGRCVPCLPPQAKRLHSCGRHKHSCGSTDARFGRAARGRSDEVTGSNSVDRSPSCCVFVFCFSGFGRVVSLLLCSTASTALVDSTMTYSAGVVQSLEMHQ